MVKSKENLAQDPKIYSEGVRAVKDALYVVNGKWKLPLLLALSEGTKRFKDIQRALDGVTPKVLSKELRDLEVNGLIVRTVVPTTPVTVSYELTSYSCTLDKVVKELMLWGSKHRDRIKAQRNLEGSK